MVVFPFIFLILLFSQSKYVICDIAEVLQDLNTELTRICSEWLDAERYGDEERTPAFENLLTEFKKRAFRLVRDYELSGSEDEYVQRQIYMYFHIGTLYLSNTILEELQNLEKYANNFFSEKFNSFEEVAFSSDISSPLRDVELQKEWKTYSEGLYEHGKYILDEFLNIVNRARSESDLVGYDNLSFWNFITKEDALPPVQEIMHVWNNELKQPFRKLLHHLKEDFSKIFKLYTDYSSTPAPFPAYVSGPNFNWATASSFFTDMIFNAYASKTNKAYKNTLLYQKVHDYEIVHHVSLEIKRMEMRTMTRKVEMYFKSLGFPELDGFFWVHSELITDEECVSPIVKVHYYSNTEYFMEARGTRSTLMYYRIHEGLYIIYRKLLKDQMDYPTILQSTDVKSFEDAFEAAVTVSAVSHTRYITEGFMTLEDYTNHFEQRSLKHQAVKFFYMLASNMAVGTWKRDVLAGNILENDRICELWNRRYQYEGIVPTTINNPPIDARRLIDVYSKNCIMESEHFEKFTTIILQFQIFARLCQLAGKYNPNDPLNPPLHLCDLHGSLTAGNVIIQVMKAGSSKNWLQLLDMIFDTPNTPLSAKGLLDYYAPLFQDILEVADSSSENVWDEPKNFCEH